MKYGGSTTLDWGEGIAFSQQGMVQGPSLPAQDEASLSLLQVKLAVKAPHPIKSRHCRTSQHVCWELTKESDTAPEAESPSFARLKPYFFNLEET